MYADIADTNDKGRGVETHDRPWLDTVLVGVPLPAPAPAPDGRLTHQGGGGQYVIETKKLSRM